MEILTSTEGQTGLPRYFRQVFHLAARLAEGRLDFALSDGRRFRIEGARPGPVAEMDIHSDDLFARMIREGELGFCDAYLEGDWTTPDLQAFLDLIQLPANNHVNDAFPGMGLVRAFERLRFWLQSNSRKQAKKNIAAHYDLGNDFYRLWLDESMTYSSALFRTGQESLERAQEAKYESMVDCIGAQPGDHVLEIGCGWGGFAEYAAAKRGLRVTGLTISQAQHDYAVERIRKAGLSDRVEIKLQDYRDERGAYDGIASIEMFEAVGERYWPVYFRNVFDRLKPGRKATLQVITVAEERWPAYRRGVDFIQKYIFPGGMLPSPGVLRAEAARAGLHTTGSIEFGDSYSQTLRRWHETFNARWSEVKRLGFDDRFKRMWDFYLTSCAGAFRGGNCDVTQITLLRPDP
ncbi:cyclopropane-fatty-acyl-phospholipid synthase family protein [Rhodobacter sp. Har01]|uniref:SAM-dependent methyltransferase n=1 Tax=Rhodobacter sp. Har01 TaxID=2883999 RepID=UPI001D068DAB|nr:cyclopropane-fatty-acyl-phospholipid synthase family protein [Rhodobacter sp. Har01]MCB6176675.1 cyclopropane-fatty-acyl-phospholipid synthase family protein [Rhodobacter sp. Har01]